PVADCGGFIGRTSPPPFVGHQHEGAAPYGSDRSVDGTACIRPASGAFEWLAEGSERQDRSCRSDIDGEADGSDRPLDGGGRIYGTAREGNGASCGPAHHIPAFQSHGEIGSQARRSDSVDG